MLKPKFPLEVMYILYQAELTSPIPRHEKSELISLSPKPMPENELGCE
jgi:hypothetical protein